MFKMGVRLQTGNIADGFEDIADYARNKLIQAMKENIDARAKGSWVEQGGVLTASGNADQFIISDAKFAPKQFAEVLQNLYVDAFKNHYKDIQRKHRSKAPQPAGQQWVDAKRENEGSPSPWNHKSIGEHVDGHIDYAIMTGFLRHSILSVFQGDQTNKYFEFDNPMLRGAWRFNIENYNFRGFNYVQKITEYFINELGILSDEQDIVDLPDDKMQKISGKMMDFLENGFSKEFINSIEKMDIEITPETG